MALIIIFILLIFNAYEFNNHYNLFHNKNTKCFYEIIEYLNSLTNATLITENPSIFYYCTHFKSSYYPILNGGEIYASLSDENSYLIYTKYESGLNDSEYKLLKSVLSKNLLEFNCSLDSENSFIYS